MLYYTYMYAVHTEGYIHITRSLRFTRALASALFHVYITLFIITRLVCSKWNKLCHCQASWSRGGVVNVRTQAPIHIHT